MPSISTVIWDSEDGFRPPLEPKTKPIARSLLYYFPMSPLTLNRRSFVAASAVLPWAFRGMASGASTSIPVGLELYSVRDALKKDPEGTVRGVAQMGYQVVEFYAPYFEWTDAQAKQMRKLMDDLGISCHSTHNGADNFGAENIERARDLNVILGSKYVVLAWTIRRLARMAGRQSPIS